MPAIENAVIAAAGLGSRLGLGLPKCMLEIDGLTILSRLEAVLRPHVDRIHVVVGYREELIIEHCARFHRELVLVRNPDYRSTNTAQSLALGARGLRGTTLFLDGDLILSPDSLARFVTEAGQHEVLIGVTRATSEQPVYVHLQDDAKHMTRFSREHASALEWANVFSAPPDIMDTARGYVFESLATRLPLPVAELELAEVDTAADLEAARRFLAGQSQRKS